MVEKSKSNWKQIQDMRRHFSRCSTWTNAIQLRFEGCLEYRRGGCPAVSEMLKVLAKSMSITREGHSGFLPSVVKFLAGYRRTAVVKERNTSKHVPLEVLINSDWAGDVQSRR